MAKYSILVPFIHPQPPDQRFQVMWIKVYSSNDADEFAAEVGNYLVQCIPLRLGVSEDLVADEQEYLDDAMAKMSTKVNTKLLQLGLPLPKTTYKPQEKKEPSRLHVVGQGQDGDG